MANRIHRCTGCFSNERDKSLITELHLLHYNIVFDIQVLCISCTFTPEYLFRARTQRNQDQDRHLIFPSFSLSLLMTIQPCIPTRMFSMMFAMM